MVIHVVEVMRNRELTSIVFIFFLISFVCGNNTPDSQQDEFRIKWIFSGHVQETVQIGDTLGVIYRYPHSTKLFLAILNITTGGILFDTALNTTELIRVFSTGREEIVVVNTSAIMILNMKTRIVRYVIVEESVKDAIYIPRKVLGFEAVALLQSSTVRIHNIENVTEAKELGVETNATRIALINTSHMLVLSENYVEIVGIAKDTRKKIPLPVSLSEPEIIVCDYDRSGKEDIIIWGRGSEDYVLLVMNDYSIWMVEYSSIEYTYVAVGDVSGDGYLDLIVCKDGFGGVICIYDLIRSTSREVFYTPFIYTDSLVLSDINNDHKLEIVIGGGNHYMWDHADPYYGAVIAINADGEVVLNISECALGISDIILYENQNILIYYSIAGWLECIELEEKTTNVYWLKIPSTRNLIERDEDVDCLSDIFEQNLGTNPNDFDTDNDKLPDGWEYMNNLDPLDPQDATLDNDNDGLNNIAEYEYGGDPWDSDTDDDGLSDYDEAQIGTDLRLSDTDGDGYSDGYEVSHGTDPLDPDDYPVPLIVRYWWVPVVCVVVIAVLVVFFYRRGVLVGKA